MLRIGIALRVDSLSRFDIMERPLTSTEHVVSLLKWTEGVIMQTGTVALFGTKILDIDPEACAKISCL